MIDRVMHELEQNNNAKSIRIIDPFCGDGRLVIKLLRAIANKKNYMPENLYIYLWDIDEVAVKSAEVQVRETALQSNLNVQIVAEKTDAFVSCFDVEGTFDVCVTNPPWGLLKPLKLFNSRCNNEELEKYKASIAGYDDYMRQEYLVSQPTSKFGRWGTNLGRCGLEVALRLISPKGVCGFVSPASLFNDQVSVPFRKWIFEKYNMSSVSYFPAELKLYGSADVSSITAVTKLGITENVRIRLFDLDFNATESTLQGADLDFVKKNDYLIPLESGIRILRLQMQWDEFVTLYEFCTRNGLRFVREMDETRWEEKVCDKGNFTFAKGYMVNKYSFEAEDCELSGDVHENPIKTL
jgi:Alw26I/Eco31I/Esp3I family type II restriction m6 adenine DNA methyltransferase